MNVSLIGPSGVGKGTCSLAMVERFGLHHLAVGELFRQNLAGRTALGLIARKYMDHGELVPDEIVDAMMEEWILKQGSPDELLFDGFPRTEYQARFLDDLLTRSGRKLDLVLLLDAPEEVLMKRMAGRMVCRQCKAPFHTEFKPSRAAGTCDICSGELVRRSDDEDVSLAVARHRIFKRTTGPLLEYYRKTGRLRLIDATLGAEAVSAACIAACRQAEGDSLFHELEAVLHPEAASPGERIRSERGNDFVLIGGPGSGKGTQAVRLSESLGVPHIATGDLFRDNLKRATDLGRMAQRYMNRGELVPDEITEEMVAHRLRQEDAASGFVLDGFPRTLPQAHALDDMLAAAKRGISGVVLLRVPDEIIVERLSGRWICRNCQAPYHLIHNPPRVEGACDHCGGLLYQRDDDRRETVVARLKTFHAQTEPLVAWYQSHGLLTEVDGVGSVDEVFERVTAAVTPGQD